MSRSSRALRQAREPHSRGPATILKAQGPSDVIAMVPYLLGFQPSDSLVVVALVGARRRFGPVLRVDLARDPAVVAALGASIAEALTANSIQRVLLVAFSADPAVADPVVGAVTERLTGIPVHVEDALRADGRRWWSYTCTDTQCCSPDGAPYDVTTAGISAEAVVSGLSFAPSRAELRRMFAPAPPERRAEVSAEIARWQAIDPRSSESPTTATSAGLVARVAQLLTRADEASAAEIAWLALAVQPLAAQDCIVSRITRAEAAAHLELWRAVMCQVGDDLLPAPGCMAAFSAWLNGTGVLASHALDRVLELAPDNGVARQLEALLVRAVDPAAWPVTEQSALVENLPPGRPERRGP